MNGLRLLTSSLVSSQIRRISSVFGWVPVMLSGILLVIGVVFLHQYYTYRMQLIQLEQELQGIKKQPVTQITSPQPDVNNTTPVNPAHLTTAALLRSLPNAEALAPSMKGLADLALQNKIALNDGDYQVQVHQMGEGVTKIQQFDMRFTVQTDYVNCRRFMIEALRHYPTMALTGVELRKNDTSESLLEAKLTFSMFVQEVSKHGT